MVILNIIWSILLYTITVTVQIEDSEIHMVCNF